MKRCAARNMTRTGTIDKRLVATGGVAAIDDIHMK